MAADILTQLEKELGELQFSGDFNLNWDKQEHAIEIEFTLAGDKNDKLVVEDQAGELNESDEVEYEDAILFYDETKLNGQDYADNYLAVIPFSGRKGINGQTLRGFFNYFQDVLVDGEMALDAFLNDEGTADTFILEWDETVFAATVAEADDLLAKTYYPYPKY